MSVEPAAYTLAGWIIADAHGNTSGGRDKVYYRDYPSWDRLPYIVRCASVQREWETWWAWKREQESAMSQHSG